jgi:hypothetical protein
MKLELRLRSGVVAVLTLAATISGCSTLDRSANRQSDRADKNRRPPSVGACSFAGNELAEVNRQIARLAELIADAGAAIQEARASRDQAIETRQGCIDRCNALSGSTATRACTAECSERARSAVTSAQSGIDSRQQNCQSLLEAIGALNEIRVDLAKTCPIRFDAGDIPPASACN